MSGFIYCKNSTSKRSLKKLKTLYLRPRKIEVERVAVIKFTVSILVLKWEQVPGG